jgi:N-acetylglucosaminyldiphosphoundecaprenol N-acetyl-beta-D-mannosaminyltransferase
VTLVKTDGTVEDLGHECDIPRTKVLGVGVSAVSLESAATEILSWSRTSGARYVAVTGVHGVIEAQDDDVFKGILNRSALTVPDGMPLVWLSWLAGRSHVTRVYGPDLTLALSKELAARGLSAFYFGGAAGVADALAGALAARFPGLVTAGTYSPPFRTLTADEKSDVIGRINASGAHVVWIGLSTPKQELWMSEFAPVLEVPALIGVGAAFDFHTGRVRQAPRWIQRSGFEWLFRLATEPRRLWRRYLRNNPRFLYYLVLERLRLRSFEGD